MSYLPTRRGSGVKLCLQLVLTSEPALIRGISERIGSDCLWEQDCGLGFRGNTNFCLKPSGTVLLTKLVM